MSNSGSVSLAKDTWRYMPLSLDAPISVSYLSTLLVTAATGGTAAMKFGLFAAASDGTPGALQTTFTPTIDLTTGAGGEVSTTALPSGERAIPAGDWFIGCAWTGTATGNPAISPIAGSHPSVTGSAVGANHNAYSQSSSGSTPPSPATPASATVQGLCVWGILT